MAAELRPSALPRAERCPASLALPAIQTADSEASAKGTRIHEMLARNGPDTPAWALPYLRELVAGGNAVETEVPLVFEGLKGSADVVARVKDTLLVADHKTGRTQVYPDSAQLSAYAVAAADTLGAGAVDSVEVVIGQLDVSDDFSEATWVIRRKTYVALDLGAERQRVRLIVRNVEDARAKAARGETLDVREGDHCDYCPAWQSCPAKATAIATVASLVGLAAPEVTIPVTAENAGAVWLAIDAMEAVLRTAREKVKELAKAGPVALPDGRELWCEESERETVVDVDKAAAVVAEVYGPEAAAEVVETKRTVTKSSLEKAAKKRAEGRTGTKAAIALVEKVRAAGACKKSSFLSYPVREKKAG